jgi:predicted permease
MLTALNFILLKIEEPKFKLEYLGLLGYHEVIVILLLEGLSLNFIVSQSFLHFFCLCYPHICYS